ncbi:DUF6555 family protein [Pseudomonas sp. RP23018S]|uniref:DUF6555 family protein n=1 Tax=Pseudomonas sp. RP23018S TaxID=3096037 RepID=UPI002ACA4C07|nr:DUF6555 family protein [Pseudomonas sp. RP23018S]MDZ5601534.1 DUF6555 family protein [Pseudomonas sp. RP23018S]
MAGQQLYVIEYALHAQPRTFIIRLERMDNAQAWHWASCDAGVGIIPRFGQHTIKKVSRPMAERYGITEVKWRVAGQGPEFVAPPIDVTRLGGARSEGCVGSS